MEQRIAHIIKTYEHQLEQLDKQYERYFDELPTNRHGEVIAEEVVKLNDWHKQWREHLNQQYVKAILNAVKGA